MVSRIGIAALILIAFVVPASSAHPSASSRLRDESYIDSSGVLACSSGNVAIQLREVQTEIRRASGINWQLSVLVIFEPESGAFSWRAAPADPKDPSWRISEFKSKQAAYMKDETIVVFGALPFTPTILVHQYHGHASSMEDAEKKALLAASRIVDPERPLNLNAEQDVYTVPLPQLGLEFVSANPMSAAASITPKVIAVKWDGKSWTLELVGRWKEEITLDSDFKVISMRKVGN